jgi:glyoxylase-like metal-dependent hydrolase (beta-lactamase superfamily II)
MRGIHVTEGIYRIPLAWGNAYLLTNGNEAALIDTGLKKDRPALLAALQEVGIAEPQVKSIFLTHAHTDHAGNAAYFAGRSPCDKAGTERNAKIYLHRDEARYLAPPRYGYTPRGSGVFKRPLSALMLTCGEFLYPVERCTPDVLLEDGNTVESPVGTLRVVACPGHTPGHIAYFRESDGLLFSGDAAINIIPIWLKIALSLPMRVFSSDWEQTKQSAKQLATLKPSLFLAGHGPPITKDTAERLRVFADSLR